MAAECGFPTKLGTPCERRVKAEFRRCHQHVELDAIPIRNLRHDSCELYVKQYGSAAREEIGRGVWGRVRSLCVKLRDQAEDSCTEYVIKSIETAALQEGVQKSVMHEIEAHQYMNSLGIGPQLADWWRCKQVIFMVMERVGMNYGELYKAQGNTFTDNDLECMFALADALDERKVIHGDFKPDNMALCSQEEKSSGNAAIAIDFGGTVGYSPTLGVFTAVPVMGWTRLPYPKCWVPRLNRHTLACFLVSHHSVDPRRFQDRGTITVLSELKRVVSNAGVLFRDQLALNSYYKEHRKTDEEEPLDAIGEDEEET